MYAYIIPPTIIQVHTQKGLEGIKNEKCRK